jgi:hypothetical protein
MAKKANRIFKKLGKNAKAEIDVVKHAAGDFSKTAFKDMKQGGNGADRICAEMVQRSYHADPEDLEAYGVVGHQLRLVMQERSFNLLKEHVHLVEGASCFVEMQERGRFFCGAQEEDTQDIAEIELQKELKRPRFQNLRRKGISRAEAMAMMNAEAGNTDEESKHISDVQNLKASVTLQNAEDVWWANCKGQAAIRRKPEDHEAVYDFADNRISMPRYLHGEKAGQLVTVKPDIHHHGGTGEVTMYTRVPKRHMTSVPDNIDKLDPKEVVILEKGADGVHKVTHGLKKHAHLSACSLPPSTRDWMDWRDAQLAKRRAAYEAAMAAGAAAGKFDKPKGDDDFHSQGGSDIDPEDLAVMSDMLSGGSPNSARKSQGGGSPQVSARRNSQQEPDSARFQGRGGRRAGVDLISMQTADSRWDARLAPNPDEMKSLLAKCMQFGHHHTGGPISWVADHHDEGGDTAPGDETDPFADELVERIWLLKSLKGPNPKVDIVFAVPLEGGFEDEVIEVDEPGSKDDDANEEFWKGVFRPIPKTFMEQMKDFFGLLN